MCLSGEVFAAHHALQCDYIEPGSVDACLWFQTCSAFTVQCWEDAFCSFITSAMPASAEAFAAHHASQCGYCTPGFVVAAHAALRRCQQLGVPPTLERLQGGLDGNLCRCTGYRPILDACRVRA
jgi:aerobic-type carbon monoxide dehydrogenase small subunit (CoxS/CutS family)